MAEVFLSRADLQLVDAGLFQLMSRDPQGPGARAGERFVSRVEKAGLELRLPPASAAEAIGVDLGEVESAKEWVEAAVAVAGAAMAVYKAYKSGAELNDRIRELVEFQPDFSIDELIEARNRVEQIMFENGL